jgi:hypothetical protein
MPEPSLIVFSFQELAELMIKQQGIHEGLWGIFIRFGIAAANASDATGTVLPTALVPIKEIGLQRFEEPSNLTVDAATVNPAPAKSAGAKKKSLGEKKAR